MHLRKVNKINRNEGHGWWNCEGCREMDHEENWDRITDGYFTNHEGLAHHPEYLIDLLQWLEDQDRFEECEFLVQFLPVYEGYTEIDLRPFLKENYNADSQIFKTYS